MVNTILNFHFDYRHPSLTWLQDLLDDNDQKFWWNIFSKSMEMVQMRQQVQYFDLFLSGPIIVCPCESLTNYLNRHLCLVIFQLVYPAYPTEEGQSESTSE